MDALLLVDSPDLFEEFSLKNWRKIAETNPDCTIIGAGSQPSRRWVPAHTIDIGRMALGANEKMAHYDTREKDLVNFQWFILV